MSPAHPPSDPPDRSNDPPTTTPILTPAQTRINTAIQNLESAEAEVDRLCSIIERAAAELSNARERRRRAQMELDEVSARMNHGEVDDELRNGVDAMDNVGRDLVSSGGGSSSKRKSLEPDEDGLVYNEVYSEEESSEGVSDSEDSSGYDSGSSRSNDDESNEEEQEEKKKKDPNDFDMDNEALDQIRYRLQIAKIDPISAAGTKLLDELLVRFQTTEESITVDLVNRFIDELLGDDKKGDPPSDDLGRDEKKEPDSVSFDKLKNDREAEHDDADKPKRIRINRGGKVLGWYEGELDSRGYAREGKGSMYYDAGHECHGTWKNDEMIGRGTYIWSDGHKYDGEWSGGKRHGLGRFIRPDGVVLYGRYEKGHHRGEGVRWSADRKEAQSMVDGVPKKSVSLAIAEFMALKLGFEDVPPPPVDTTGSCKE